MNHRAPLSSPLFLSFYLPFNLVASCDFYPWRLYRFINSVPPRQTHMDTQTHTHTQVWATNLSVFYGAIYSSVQTLRPSSLWGIEEQITFSGWRCERGQSNHCAVMIPYFTKCVSLGGESVGPPLFLFQRRRSRSVGRKHSLILCLDGEKLLFMSDNLQEWHLLWAARTAAMFTVI